MILSGPDQTRFPQATRYVRYVLPTVINIPVIVRAMERFAQLDRAAFRRALGWGAQPTIEIVPDLDACGSFTPTPGNNVIQIRESIFTDFEAGRGYLRTRYGWVPALGLNILHETVHWGDNLDGVDFPGEEGDLFELAVYGVDLGC
jgi:hypothetical protein